MSLDAPNSNKMMEAAPAKKQFHFSGDGIWHNLSILAEDLVQATKIWHEQKQPIDTEASAPVIKPEAVVPAEEITNEK